MFKIWSDLSGAKPQPYKRPKQKIFYSQVVLCSEVIKTQIDRDIEDICVESEGKKNKALVLLELQASIGYGIHLTSGGSYMRYNNIFLYHY